MPIAADKTTEGDQELTLTLTGKGVSETITIEDTCTEAVVTATYDLSAVESSVKEGEDAEFLIETDPSQTGKSFKWSITGVSTSDVACKGSATSDRQHGSADQCLGVCNGRSVVRHLVPGRIIFVFDELMDCRLLLLKSPNTFQ